MAIEGVTAAVITPRTPNGELDETALRGWLEFLMKRGIKGFAINGATGEFCLTTEPEFERLMAVVAETIQGRATMLAGVGAANAATSIRLARLAAKAGAEALLLPMPYFFPYSQGDLKTFSRTVAATAGAPVLLYNLPQFTTRLDPETSVELIRECEEIIGIKDSSGSLDTVRLLTAEGVAARRIIGNDGALAAAMVEGVADGVVSGVACVLPELMGQLWAQGSKRPKGEEFDELASTLRFFIEQLDHFPTPWGLKIIGEALGLAPARFPFPLSPERELKAREFARWFADHKTMLKAQ